MEAGLVNTRTAIAMMVAGGLITLGGLIWLVTGDFDETVAAAAPGTADAPATTSSAAPNSTLAEGEATTVAPTTTSSTTTTTTTEPLAEDEATTTTAPPVETVEEFLALFRAALDADDVDFLYNRLHPIVTDAFGADLCRAFVEREIAILENYEATAAAGAPITRSVQGVEVDIIDVPVEFDFQGQHFEAVSTYALIDGQVRYFSECR